mmetsp:Transcript_111754/g.197978  ORF Transcript_111754/g.197978 Transcript_111754/m.197978 type:complete len:245 (-) Transcript_111754:216-950(-)
MEIQSLVKRETYLLDATWEFELHELPIDPDDIGVFFSSSDDKFHHEHIGPVHPVRNSSNCVTDWVRTISLAHKFNTHDEDQHVEAQKFNTHWDGLLSCYLSTPGNGGSSGKREPDATGRWENWVHNVFFGYLKPARNPTNCVDLALKYAYRTKEPDTLGKALVLALWYKTHEEEELQQYKKCLLSQELSYAADDDGGSTQEPSSDSDSDHSSESSSLPPMANRKRHADDSEIEFLTAKVRRLRI